MPFDNQVASFTAVSNIQTNLKQGPYKRIQTAALRQTKFYLLRQASAATAPTVAA